MNLGVNTLVGLRLASGYSHNATLAEAVSADAYRLLLFSDLVFHDFCDIACRRSTRS
jgi:hypothetical protein